MGQSWWDEVGGTKWVGRSWWVAVGGTKLVGRSGWDEVGGTKLVGARKFLHQLAIRAIHHTHIAGVGKSLDIAI